MVPSKTLDCEDVGHGSEASTCFEDAGHNHPTLLSYVEEYRSGKLAKLPKDRSYKPSNCLEGRMEEISTALLEQPLSGPKHCREVVA